MYSDALAQRRASPIVFAWERGLNNGGVDPEGIKKERETELYTYVSLKPAIICSPRKVQSTLRTDPGGWLQIQIRTQVVSSPHGLKLRVSGVSAGGKRGGELLRDASRADGAVGGDAGVVSIIIYKADQPPAKVRYGPIRCQSAKDFVWFPW